MVFFDFICEMQALAKLLSIFRLYCAGLVFILRLLLFYLRERDSLTNGEGIPSSLAGDISMLRTSSQIQAFSLLGLFRTSSVCYFLLLSSASLSYSGGPPQKNDSFPLKNSLLSPNSWETPSSPSSKSKQLSIRFILSNQYQYRPNNIYLIDRRAKKYYQMRNSYQKFQVFSSAQHHANFSHLSPTQSQLVFLRLLQ